MGNTSWQGFMGSDTSLSLPEVMIAMVIGFVLSLLLKWHFHRFGSSFSNKKEFSAIFPFLVLTVTLIIAVVKSSLALSLGLVGALSIVRFRTPVKEPEELAYIFMAIAIGLGLGANQVPITVSATLLIILLMSFFKYTHRSRIQNLYLSVGQEGGADGFDVEEITRLVQSHADVCDLRRVDQDAVSRQVVYYIEVKNLENVYALMKAVRERAPNAGVSLIDQHRIPGI